MAKKQRLTFSFIFISSNIHNNIIKRGENKKETDKTLFLIERVKSKVG